MSPKLELAKNLLSFEELLTLFFDFFTNEYRQEKTREIILNVEKSAKANRFIADSFRTRRRYNHESYVGVIQTGRRFLIKRAEVVCCASLVLLEKWRAEVGAPIGLAEEGYLKEMFFRIIFECDKQKTHINRNHNLFERYFHELEKIVDFLLTQQTKADEEKDKSNLTDEVSYEEGDWTTLDDEPIEDDDILGVNTSTPNLTEVDLSFLDPPSWSRENYGCQAGYYIVDGRKFCKTHLIPYNSSGRCPN